MEIKGLDKVLRRIRKDRNSDRKHRVRFTLKGRKSKDGLKATFTASAKIVKEGA